MNCPRCGAANPSGAKFCRKCGAILAEAEKPQPAKEKQDSKGPNPSVDVVPKTDSLSSTAETMVNQGRSDETCPHCGGTHCDPITRTNTKINAKGPSTTGCCCGICLFGPVGALCGLCGMGVKVNSSSSAVWICRDCGKEHLSRTDALAKAQVMAASYALVILVGALIVSTGVMVGNWPWLIAVGWAASPVIGWELISDELSKALGYPLTEILPSSVSIKTYLAIATVVVVLVLIFGGPIVDSFMAGL